MKIDYSIDRARDTAPLLALKRKRFKILEMLMEAREFILVKPTHYQEVHDKWHPLLMKVEEPIKQEVLKNQ